ncbi:hypothetical protein AARAC_003143 [Aspergillus arachidicola]|uniref:Uncharacterized protein n=1 Tax=Aspergillus arachidicola TaxID=656916 RepID=A0A2G7FQJ2_9EURO|nr:hypothetical protein AARAC_003143 [Aspergillus arachidicola]
MLCHEVGQYIALKQVVQRDFISIERNHGRVGGAVRLSYVFDIETLIIKVPSSPHEKAHVNLSSCLTRKVTMIVTFTTPPAELESFLFRVERRRKTFIRRGCKSNSVSINDLLKPGGWPLLVIEALESMHRLQADAAWWIASSSGQMNLVLLINVTRNSRKIEVEKHVPMQAMGLPTRLRPGTEYKPRKVATIKISQGVNFPTVRGMALRLEVEKVIGRALNPPLEQGIIFTSAELLEWARYVFV